MSINIALKPELEESLTRQADVRGVSLDMYVTQVLEQYAAQTGAPPPTTPEDRAQAFESWARNFPQTGAPPLSDEAISRESLYRTDDDQ